MKFLAFILASLVLSTGLAGPKVKALPTKKVKESPVSAETIYEGWHRVLSGGQHVGYVVQKYEFEPKSKVFQSTYFLKTNALGGNITEGLTARATDAMKPLGYQYTTSDGKTNKMIDASFNGEKMVLTVSTGRSVQKFEKTVPKGTFLSTFLVYVMLQNKEGLKVGNNYSYTAIAEESGDVAEGTAFVKETVKVNGIDAFRILNTFNKIQFVSIVNGKGEGLATKSPLLSLATEAVPSQTEAVGNLTFDSKSIITLFGKVPGNTTGLPSSPTNTAGPEKEQALKGASDAAPANKEEGVPGGQGIHIKKEGDGI